MKYGSTSDQKDYGDLLFSVTRVDSNRVRGEMVKKA